MSCTQEESVVCMESSAARSSGEGWRFSTAWLSTWAAAAQEGAVLFVVLHMLRRVIGELSLLNNRADEVHGPVGSVELTCWRVGGLGFALFRWVSLVVQ